MKLPKGLTPPDFGTGHDWVELDPVGIGSVSGASWDRFTRKYSVPTERGTSVLPTATYFCNSCHTLVPESGPRSEDEDCGPLQVALVMES